MLTLNNHTDWPAQLTPGETADGQLHYSLVVKTSWQIAAEKPTLRALAKPVDIILADEFAGDAKTSSLTGALDTMPFKQGSEILIKGKAHPEHNNRKWTDIAAVVRWLDGSIWNKQLRVHCERVSDATIKGLPKGQPKLRPIKPVEPTDVVYEHALGFAQDEQGFSANPAGVMIDPEHLKKLPKDLAIDWYRIEYLPTDESDKPASDHTPAGFGPIPPFWQPRADLNTDPEQAEDNAADDAADDAVDNTEDHPTASHPLAKHNTAPLDQQFPHTFQGGEMVGISGWLPPDQFPKRQAQFQLPPAGCQVEFVQPDGKRLPLQLVGDTVIIDTEAQTVSQLWRTIVPHAVVDPTPMWVEVLPTDAGVSA